MINYNINIHLLLYICRAPGFSINFEPIIFGHTVFPQFHPVHVDTFTCVQFGQKPEYTYEGGGVLWVGNNTVTSHLQYVSGISVFHM